LCNGPIIIPCWLALLKSPGKDLFLFRLFIQVFVERHRDVANEYATERGQFDAVAVEPHKAIPLKFAQAFKLRRKMVVEAYAKITLDLALHKNQMTEYAAYD
jgi:hypothetical protein